MGELYNRSFHHASTIVWNHHGLRLEPQDQVAKQYHPISEETAAHVRLLLDAITRTTTTNSADSLARAIADMHPSESSWWYACTQNRGRPRRVLDALTLMYS